MNAYDEVTTVSDAIAASYIEDLNANAIKNKNYNTNLWLFNL